MTHPADNPRHTRRRQQGLGEGCESRPRVVRVDQGAEPGVAQFVDAVAQQTFHGRALEQHAVVGADDRDDICGLVERPEPALVLAQGALRLARVGDVAGDPDEPGPARNGLDQGPGPVAEGPDASVRAHDPELDFVVGVLGESARGGVDGALPVFGVDVRQPGLGAAVEGPGLQPVKALHASRPDQLTGGRLPRPGRQPRHLERQVEADGVVVHRVRLAPGRADSDDALCPPTFHVPLPSWTASSPLYVLGSALKRENLLS